MVIGVTRGSVLVVSLFYWSCRADLCLAGVLGVGCGVVVYGVRWFLPSLRCCCSASSSDTSSTPSVFLSVEPYTSVFLFLFVVEWYGVSVSSSSCLIFRARPAV